MRVVMTMVTLLACLANEMRAQADTSKTPRGFWASGVSVGLPGIRSETAAAAVTLAGSFTRVARRKVGFDGAIITLPRALADGFIPVVTRMGPNVAMEVSPDLFVVPTAGVVVMVALGPEDAAGAAGLYGGVGLISFGPGSMGVRTAYTRQRFLDIDATIWHLEFGLVRRFGAKG
ncbi:MAG TPA: hypothetical protein VFO55_03380 [Gemmatimonadaceae bacterium]|nr:hypothetical protein [Gemmatimonadaceae bacterium]